MSRHTPITIQDLSIIYPSKTCFTDFSTTIPHGKRIAIIGDNGSGKTSLLKHLTKNHESGYLPQDFSLEEEKTVWEVAVEYVKHIFDDLEGLTDLNQYEGAFERLSACDGFDIENQINTLLSQMNLFVHKDKLVNEISGGQKMMLGLVRILSTSPQILLLDEPTNHLDTSNRNKIIDFLENWKHTAIIISHDINLLKTWPEQIWHIQNGKINIFNGNYEGYLKEEQISEEQRLKQIEVLQKEQRQIKAAIDKEQSRQAKGKRQTLKRDPDINERRSKEGKAQATLNRKTKEFNNSLNTASNELKSLRQSKKIKAKFHLNENIKHSKSTISIEDGKAGYDDWILTNLNLIVEPKERIALLGDNGSGKSTLIKAIMRKQEVKTEGEWFVPCNASIGYLDQSYSTIDRNTSVLEAIKEVRPEWKDPEIRKHLNDFLFRKNEEVNALAKTLSGGELARLSLAKIAAKSPNILFLDEITNNLDITTRNHVIDVLNAYHGTLIVISHDIDFLNEIGIQKQIELKRQLY